MAYFLQTVNVDILSVACFAGQSAIGIDSVLLREVLLRLSAHFLKAIKTPILIPMQNVMKSKLLSPPKRINLGKRLHSASKSLKKPQLPASTLLCFFQAMGFRLN